MKISAWILILPLAACTPTESPRSEEVVGRKMIGLEGKFDLLDTNGDGYLSRTELTSGYDQLGVVTQTPETTDNLFNFYDANGDNRISLVEAQSGSEAGANALIRSFQ